MKAAEPSQGAPLCGQTQTGMSAGSAPEYADGKLSKRGSGGKRRRPDLSLFPGALGHWLFFFHSVAIALVPPIKYGACDKYRGESARHDAEHEHEREVHDNSGPEKEEGRGRQERAETRENRSRHRLVNRIIDDFPERHRGLELEL